jgi:divalent metal cation (Fe/Co/Zn/Cd) transporter
MDYERYKSIVIAIAKAFGCFAAVTCCALLYTEVCRETVSKLFVDAWLTVSIMIYLVLVSALTWFNTKYLFSRRKRIQECAAGQLDKLTKQLDVEWHEIRIFDIFTSLMVVITILQLGAMFVRRIV